MVSQTEMRTLWRPAHCPEVAKFPQCLSSKGSGQMRLGVGQGAILRRESRKWGGLGTWREGCDIQAQSSLPCVLGRVRGEKDELAQALGPET